MDVILFEEGLAVKEVKSSNISRVGFKDGVMSVKFKSGDKIYDYHGVTEAEHKEFVEAESVGTHFHKNFKHRDFTKRDK